MWFISRLARWRKNDEEAIVSLRPLFVGPACDFYGRGGNGRGENWPCFFCVSRRVYKYCCFVLVVVLFREKLLWRVKLLLARLRNYKYFVFLLIFMRVPFLKFSWESVVEKKHREKSTLRCRWYANGKRNVSGKNDKEMGRGETSRGREKYFLRNRKEINAISEEGKKG